MKHSSSIAVLALSLSTPAIADMIYTSQGAYPIPPQAVQPQQVDQQPGQQSMPILSQNATGGTQQTIVDENGNLKVVDKKINPIPGQNTQVGASQQQPTTFQQNGMSQPREPGPIRDVSGQQRPNQLQQNQMQQPSQMQPSQMQPSQNQPAQMQPSQNQLAPTQPAQVQAAPSQPVQMQPQGGAR